MNQPARRRSYRLSQEFQQQQQQQQQQQELEVQSQQQQQHHQDNNAEAERETPPTQSHSHSHSDATDIDSDADADADATPAITTTEATPAARPAGQKTTRTRTLTQASKSKGKGKGKPPAGPPPPPSTGTGTSTSTSTSTMDTAHRKIELQSPDDLAYLVDNVRRAAAASIDAAFPPVDGARDEAPPEDDLRVRIERLVYEYIRQTFTLASPNLSVNGLPVDPDRCLADILPPQHHHHRAAAPGPPEDPDEPEVQYEPFDGRKRQRVEDLAREEEDLLREIASLKRRVPAAAASRLADAWAAGLRADEDALEGARRRVAEEAAAVAAPAPAQGDGDDGGDDDKDGKDEKTPAGGKRRLLLGDLGPLERQADVERGFGDVVATLGRLQREMPATVAKMERARVAGEYVVTER